MGAVGTIRRGVTGPSVPWLGEVLVGRVGTDAVMRDRLVATDPSEVTRP